MLSKWCIDSRQLSCLKRSELDQAYLSEGSGVKVPFSCAVSQSPYFGQYRARQPTALKELDSIWTCQLVVMICNIQPV